MENPWTRPSFVDAVKGHSPHKPYYTGEDEEDPLDDLALADVFQLTDEAGELESCPFVDINWDRYKAHWQPWRRALIIRVLGKKFHLKVLAPRVKRLWQLADDCELIDLDKWYFIARFFSREDYLKVLQGGPWMVLGHYLMITKWRPNLVPTEEAVATTLIWIRLPHVPVEMFYEEALLDMANVIGKAIWVESTGEDVLKGRYARVCVELNLQHALVPVINVMGRRQVVEYEGLYRVFYHCGQFGHRADQCPTHNASSPGAAPDAPRQPTPPSEPRSTPETPFGPWLMQAHVRCWMQQTQHRMAMRSEPSDANKALNCQIEAEIQTRRRQALHTPPNARSCFTTSATLDSREPSPLSATTSGAPGNRSTTPVAHQSRFAALGDIEEDGGLPDRITILK